MLFKQSDHIKIKQRFKSERYDVYTEEINKIALSSNDDKRLQTFDRITSYPYGTSAGKVCKNRAIKQIKYKVINFDGYTYENKKEHNPKWPYVSGYCWGLWIRKNKCIIKFNKQLTQY